MESKKSQTYVALRNGIIFCNLSGNLNEEILLTQHLQLLHLIKQTGCRFILFDNLRTDPSSPNVEHMQKIFSGELQSCNIKLAVLLRGKRSAYFPRLALGEMNYRLFYEDAEEAIAWLKSDNFAFSCKRKLLVADVPEAFPALTHALQNQFQLLNHASWSGACAAVHKGVDLVLCGLHFEDSKMFDLLEYLRSHEKTKSIPFCCIKSTRLKLLSTVNDSLGIALHAKGTAGYIDYEEWRARLGEQQASHRLRQKIEEVLSASTRKA